MNGDSFWWSGASLVATLATGSGIFYEFKTHFFAMTRDALIALCIMNKNWHICQHVCAPFVRKNCDNLFDFDRFADGIS